MELQPKGCIHFQEREKQYSTLEKLVKAEIAELNNDKAKVLVILKFTDLSA